MTIRGDARVFAYGGAKCLATAARGKFFFLRQPWKSRSAGGGGIHNGVGVLWPTRAELTSKKKPKKTKSTIIGGAIAPLPPPPPPVAPPLMTINAMIIWECLHIGLAASSWFTNEISRLVLSYHLKKKKYHQTFSINSFQNCELIWMCFRILEKFYLHLSENPIQVLTEGRLTLHKHSIPHLFWMVYVLDVHT